MRENRCYRAFGGPKHRSNNYKASSSHHHTVCISNSRTKHVFKSFYHYYDYKPSRRHFSKHFTIARKSQGCIVSRLCHCKSFRLTVKSMLTSIQVQFCSENDWRYCNPVLTSPLNCTSTDDMIDVKSIAIGLGMCCRFYRYFHLY